jgi:hypothetical protein
MKLMQQTASAQSAYLPHQQASHTSHVRKHSTRRQKVKLSIWVEMPEKTELERLAKQNGLSLSGTGRAILIDGIRQRLRLEREVLAMPILEAFFGKKMNQVVNRLAEFLGRSIYETGQMRWLYVNTLYHESLRRIASEPDPKKKDALQKEFYNLLDTSQKETMKAVRQWNPNISDVVASIKERLKEKEETT